MPMWPSPAWKRKWNRWGADMATVTTRRITRDKLAQFLKGPDGRPSLELIRAFEGLFEDVSQTIPGEIDIGTELIQSAELSGGAARAEAGVAMALALSMQSRLDLAASAPVRYEHAPVKHLCDGCAQIHALREEVAVLRAQVRSLQIATH